MLHGRVVELGLYLNLQDILVGFFSTISKLFSIDDVNSVGGIKVAQLPRGRLQYRPVS